MLNKEKYFEELKRYFDSVRDDCYKDEAEYPTACIGIPCHECIFKYKDEKCIFNMRDIFEVLDRLEKWSEEHPPKHKISQLEYSILCIALDHEYIEFCDSYILSDILELEAGYFEGATKNTNIIDYLKNCEVEDDEK